MKHECSHQVRGYELDGYGHVNNAVYLNYLEYARGEYLKAIGFDYEGFIKAGYGFWIVRIEIDYKLPAQRDQLLAIESEMHERKQTFGIMRQVIRGPSGVCAEALVKWAFVNLATGRPTRIPPEFEVAGMTP